METGKKMSYEYASLDERAVGKKEQKMVVA
jgi:hypothetical protein